MMQFPKVSPVCIIDLRAKSSTHEPCGTFQITEWKKKVFSLSGIHKNRMTAVEKPSILTWHSLQVEVLDQGDIKALIMIQAQIIMSNHQVFSWPK